MRILRAITGRRSGVIGFTLMGSLAMAALLAPSLATADPFAITGQALEPPSSSHLMGTDALGRDLFSGVVHGARTSLALALFGGLLAFLCGTAVGLVAGYHGGIVDDALMRVTELFQVMPRFFLVVVAIALFGPGPDRVVLILGLTSWAVLARVVRTEVLATRNLEFVLSSEALGASRTHLLLRVLLPHVLPAALVMLGLVFGQLLLIEASVGFIGLGDPGALTWGVLAGQAQGYMRSAWWLSLFPGLAITTAVIAFNLLADAVADIVRTGYGTATAVTAPSLMVPPAAATEI
ncbi:MAG TPA: ABC transporter permease [Gemmatimonadaceae bacterium]|nr:ABC transporter permease [Gemmatimonadaceae bacterium]